MIQKTAFGTLKTLVDLHRSKNETYLNATQESEINFSPYRRSFVRHSSGYWVWMAWHWRRKRLWNLYPDAIWLVECVDQSSSIILTLVERKNEIFCLQTTEFWLNKCRFKNSLIKRLKRNLHLALAIFFHFISNGCENLLARIGKVFWASFDCCYLKRKWSIWNIYFTTAEILHSSTARYSSSQARWRHRDPGMRYHRIESVVA